METEIFTCKYFKFGRNTTGLSQSHLRNFLACSINLLIPLATSDSLFDFPGPGTFSKWAKFKILLESTAQTSKF